MPTAQTFVSRNGGLYSLDKNNQRKPFVFGSDKMLDGTLRRAPFEHAGLAAIEILCEKNTAIVARQYDALVQRFARNIDAGRPEISDTGTFLKEFVKETKNENFPHPGFVFDIRIAKGVDLYPFLIYDVAVVLGVESAGMSLTGKVPVIYMGGCAVYVEKETKNGRQIDNIRMESAIKENYPKRKDDFAPIYDAAQLQSALCVLVAEKKDSGSHPEDAVRIYRVAVALSPENADARSRLGRELMALGRREEGVRECEQAAELDPFDSEVQNRLATALYQTGDLTRAQKHYHNAVKCSTNEENRASYYFNWAVAFAGTNLLGNAAWACSKGIGICERLLKSRALGGRLGNDYADAYLFRCRLYNKMGMKKEAGEDFHKHEELARKQADGNP